MKSCHETSHINLLFFLLALEIEGRKIYYVASCALILYPRTGRNEVDFCGNVFINYTGNKEFKSCIVGFSTKMLERCISCSMDLEKIDFETQTPEYALTQES